MKKITYTAFFVVLAVLAMCVFCFYQKPSQTTDKSGIVNSVIFNCAENKNIQAIFFKDKVELTLSDGRNMLLSQAISASGARYANADESFVFWNKGDTAFINEGATTTFKECLLAPTAGTNEASSAQLANPASVNCSKAGGDLKIEKRGDGGEYGLCYFEDNRACEEWALLRGECPLGGVKTTGFETVDQSYCAWSGGQTFSVPNSVCTFKNGIKCPTIDFYNGKCSSASESDETINWKTYKNNEGKYSFKYPTEWNAVTNKYNSKNSLFGPGATNESGYGGVEFYGTLSSGQSLKDFIKKFNSGVEGGSVSETAETINGKTVIVSILPKASTEPTETKSVAFEKDGKVFNVYLMYKTDFNKYPADEQRLNIFNRVVSTFDFF